MKGIVIYYSQTGNTKRIAEAIHSGMSKVADTADLVFIKGYDPNKLKEYDLIGIGAPVWRGFEPGNVTRFLDDMPELDNKYCFTFCTHGTFPGRYIANMVAAFRKKGATVSGWNDWYGGVGANMGGIHPYYTDGHPDEIDLGGAEDFGKEIVERTLRISNGETDLIPELEEGREYGERYGMAPPMPPVDGERPNPIELEMSIRAIVNTEKCKHPKCSICMDNCPTDSINPSNAAAFDEKTCLKCFFCEQICPTGAIEIDRSPIENVLDDSMFISMANQMMEFKKLRGFRPLVPLEEVGKNPPADMNKHPWLVIRDGVGVPRKT